MAGYDDQILELNPWWRSPDALAKDPHLVRMGGAGFHWDPPALRAIPLEPGGIHTLRGPRQVGKTTTVKTLVERLVRAGQSRVLYYSFDLERDARAIRDVIVRAKQLHPDPDGSWYLFLDEVTSIPDWQLGLKYLWDNGHIRQDFVVCTGSSARKMGAEQLPGRRGTGRDFVHLPLSFRAFCTDVLLLPLPTDTVEVARLFGREGRQLIHQIHLQAGALHDALAHFTETGGFPAAVQDAVTGVDLQEPIASLMLRPVRPETVRMLWDIIAGDVQEAGRDKTATLKLLERVGFSLGSPVAWDSLRQDMDVGSHNTAKEYTHLLSQAFILLTVYFWGAGTAFEPDRQRKLYFIDPLIGRIAKTLMHGARAPKHDGVLENLVAVGLFRAAAETLALADPLPGGIGYWKSSDNREIDFIVPRGNVPDDEDTMLPKRDRIAVEVKGDNAKHISAARLSIRRTHGRGVVLTRTVFDWHEDVPAIPVSVFLATLGDRPQRESHGV